jgi:hypothetical protein
MRAFTMTRPTPNSMTINKPGEGPDVGAYFKLKLTIEEDL